MHCDSKAFSFLRCLDEGDEVGEPFSSSSLHDRSSMPPCCRLLNAALREKGKSAAEQYAHERSHSNQDRVAHTSRVSLSVQQGDVRQLSQGHPPCHTAGGSAAGPLSPHWQSRGYCPPPRCPVTTPAQLGRPPCAGHPSPREDHCQGRSLRWRPDSGVNQRAWFPASWSG
jgi:hypothetical protein